MNRSDIDIAPAELERRRAAGEDILILDVREPWEVAICAIAGSVSIPLGQLSDRYRELPQDRPVAVVCHHGARSLRAAQWLRDQGRGDALNIAGGVDAWADEVAPGMARY